MDKITQTGVRQKGKALLYKRMPTNKYMIETDNHYFITITATTDSGKN